MLNNLFWNSMQDIVICLITSFELNFSDCSHCKYQLQSWSQIFVCKSGSETACTIVQSMSVYYHSGLPPAMSYALLVVSIFSIKFIVSKLRNNLYRRMSNKNTYQTCNYLYLRKVFGSEVNILSLQFIASCHCILSMLLYSDCVGIVWTKSTSKLCLHQQEVLSRISDSFSEL